VGVPPFHQRPPVVVLVIVATLVVVVVRVAVRPTVETAWASSRTDSTMSLLVSAFFFSVSGKAKARPAPSAKAAAVIDQWLGRSPSKLLGAPGVETPLAEPVSGLSPRSGVTGQGDPNRGRGSSGSRNAEDAQPVFALLLCARSRKRATVR